MAFIPKYPKMSLSKMGKNNPRFGFPVSLETRKKLSIAHKGRIRGKMSEEHKKKLSETQKRIGNKPPYVQKGKNHWNWKGGISPLYCRIRASKEYKLWRTAVFQRDNYTCIFCGSRNGNGKKIILNADHIKPFSQYPELRFAIDNGRTLCIDCHKKITIYN